MLSVVTLRVLTTAHAALDTLEMEHYALVYIYIILTYAPTLANGYVRERLVNGLWLRKTRS